MKTFLQLFLLFLGLSTTWYFLISSTDGVVSVFNSGGPAASGNGDRTGGPLSGGSTCSSCHGGGSFSPSLTVTVKNGGGNPVTQYIPGQTYTVEYQVNAGAGSPAGFGFQSVPLTSSNAQGGNLTAFSSSNSKITNFSGKKYAEHSGFNPTGFFSYTWVAPSAGTGNITFYSVGMAVNGTGGTTGDQASGASTKVLTEVIPTTINYAPAYCSNGADPTPTITGTAGGTFSASPAGLSLNSTTGKVDLSASTTGVNFTVTYTHANGTATDVLKINPNYALSNSATICSNDSILLAGAYQKTAGTYVSNLTTTKGCDSIVTTTLTVNPAYLIQLNQSICQGDSVLIFGLYRKSAGSYSQNNMTTLGCDSVQVVHLTLNPTYDLANSETVCEGDSVLVNGTYYKDDGVDIENNTTLLGCDSIITTTITKITIDTLLTLNGTQLSANQTGANYQWFNCANNTMVQGATNIVFTPSSNGSYYCQISKDGCVLNSECKTVSTIGLEERNQLDFSLSPNPSNGHFKLLVDPSTNIEGMTIFSETGQRMFVLKEVISNQELRFPLVNGIYFLQIHSNNKIFVQKLVVIN